MINNPSVGGSAPAAAYKVYSALISQAGVAAPTVVVLQNTLPGAIVWTRSSPGVYVGTLAGAFTANKTWMIIKAAENIQPNTGCDVFTLDRVDANSVQIVSGLFFGVDGAGGANIDIVDALLGNTEIEIRVYT